MMKKIFSVLMAMFAIVLAVSAQPGMGGSVVSWSATAAMTSDTEGVVTVTADIEPGWHVYGFDSSDGGPVATTMSIEGSQGVVLDPAGVEVVTTPTRAMDDIFEVEISWWEGKAEFRQRFTVEPGTVDPQVTVSVNFMACNDMNCRPPRTETITVDVAPAGEGCCGKCCGSCCK